MNSVARTYLIQFGAATVAYLVLLIVSIGLIQANPHASWRLAVAVLPVIPAIFGALALVRYVGKIDELQRRIQLDGFAFSFGVTAILTFTYGFLENAGLPPISFIWVLPLMIFLWGIGTAIASARYR